MSDQEKQAAEEMAKTLTKAMLILPTNQQERVVGIVQGMAMAQQVLYRATQQEGFPLVRLSPRRILIPADGLERWLESGGYHRSKPQPKSDSGADE